jgi:hypothetical protein
MLPVVLMLLLLMLLLLMLLLLRLTLTVSRWHGDVLRLLLVRRAIPQTSGVSLSTVWVWEFEQQDNTGYSVWPSVDGALIADMVAVNAKP